VNALLIGLHDGRVDAVRSVLGDGVVIAPTLASALESLGADPAVIVLEQPADSNLLAACRAIRRASNDDSILLVLVGEDHQAIEGLLDAGANDFFVASFGEIAFRARLRVALHAARLGALRRQAATDHDKFFQIALDHLCVAGFDGFFKRVSPSWTTTFGWTADELCAKPLLDFVHPDDVAATAAARVWVLDGESLIAFTNRYVCRDGTYRSLEWRSVSDSAQRLVYATARDVTDQLATEELQSRIQHQLLLADRMASVGTLAAGVAHEINNPLSNVSANLDMVIEELRGLAAGSARLRDVEAMARDARQGAERIRKIVRGLKTFARAEEERPTVVDVRDVLELSISMALYAIRHRAQLVRSYGETPPVTADDARLGQVFINLLINAAQAIPEGDVNFNEIRIATSTDASGRAVVEVIDSGSGIPASALGRIFDPFFTTKAVGIGTGLGLSICHNIVTGMGGDITVQSVVGKGTTFRVTLPPASTAPQPIAEPAPSSTQPIPLHRASVLVVDDEPMVGTTLGRVLREHDVTVLTRAQDALELIRSGRHFDVILSDLMMPEMSGMELFDELSRFHPESAKNVVFISGGAFTTAANAFLDAVPNERLEKPFDSKRVRALVSRFVKKPTS
jgi:PAS domain S-box-containing protein